MSDINLIISATDSASPVLKRIEKSLEGLHRQAKKAEQSSLTLSRAFRGIAAAAATIGLAQISRGLVGTIAKFESLQASLKTVTGSAADASVAFQQIQDFTATTPFQLDDVTESFIILKRNGIDTSTASLRAFGNIAAAQGRSLQQLAEAIADGMTGEFERLKEFGIVVRRQNDQFVASMGGTQIAVTNSSRALMEELRKLGEDGGRFMTGLSDQAATLGGKFSNLQDNITQFAAAIGEGGLKNALKDTVDIFNEMFGTSGDLAKSIGEVLGKAVNGLNTALVFVTDNIQRIVSYIKAVAVVAFASFAAQAGAAAVALIRVEGALKLIRAAMIRTGIGALIVAVGELIYQFDKFAEANGGVVNALTKMKNVSMEVLGRVKEGFGLLGEEISWFFTKVGQRVEIVMLRIKKTIQDMINTAISGINQLIPSLPEWMGGGGDLIPEVKFMVDGNLYDSTTGQPIQRTVEDQIEHLTAILRDSEPAMRESLNWSWENLFRPLESLNTQVENETIPTLGALRGWFSYMGEAAADAGESIEEGVGNGSRRALSYVQKLAKAANEMLETMIKTREQNQINADLLPVINSWYASGAITLREYSKALEDIGSGFEPLEVKAFRTAETIKQNMAQMAGAITDVFFDMFTGVTSVFEGMKNIAKMVLQMVMKAIIQAYIVKPLLAFMGIPMFANGGIAKANQPAIVGENGPELIVPNRDSRIFSNSQTKQIMSDEGSSVTSNLAAPKQEAITISQEPLTVNFNLTAVDTQTGVQFLLENKSTITGMIQQAYNQRGVRGPLG